MNNIFSKMKVQETSFNLFYSILIGIFTIFALSFTGFIFHISINPLYSILGIFASLITLFILGRKNHTSCIHIFCMSAVLLVIYLIALLGAGHFYDFTPDGLAFHQLGIIMLGNGWNPVFDNPSDFAEILFNTKAVGESVTMKWDLVWVENYTKFTEIMAANFYTLTKHIECGKAIHFLSIISVFFYSLYILNKPIFSNINIWFKIIISVLFVYNPVVITQSITYCIDDCVYLYFMMILFAIIDTETSEKESVLSWSIVILSSVILANVKFGGVFHLIISFIGYGIYVLIKQDFAKFKKLVLSFVITIIICLISGINPYFTNIINNRNPLHPLAGSQKNDVIKPMTPKYLQDKNCLSKLFITTFSKTGDIGRNLDNNIYLKPPFWMYKSELKYIWPQQHLAGFGIFWSGILILSIILACFIRYKAPEEKRLGLFIFTLLCLLLFLNPASWWARYAPHFWSIPIFIIIFILNTKCNFLNKIITILMIILMFINTTISIIYVSKKERHFRKFINKTYLNKDNKKVLNIYGTFYISFTNKLKENNIPYRLVTKEYYEEHKSKFKDMPMMMYTKWCTDD